MNADRELRAETHVAATPDEVWAVLGDVRGDVEPGRLVVWDTASSGARWIWKLVPEPNGTLVVHRRLVPRRITLLTRLFAGAFLGGVDRHSDDLEHDMALSVARLKVVVDGQSG